MDNEGPLPSAPEFDQKTKQQVVQCLNEDKELKGASIRVDVIGGNVTLSGYIDTPALKQYAESCVKKINGVGEVINQLQVRIQSLSA